LELLKQTTSVAEYHSDFEKLAHGILLYNPAYDDTYFVTRFLARLREEIRAPIALHRPRDVDTASALALLQEEELNSIKQRSMSRALTKGVDRNLADKARGSGSDKRVQKSDSEDKLATLKQYRRKNGLCFKCGGKWSTTHSCPEQIPLHVLEELWDALELSEWDDAVEDQSDVAFTEDTVCALQSPETPQNSRKQTLKLLAKIGKHQLLILVDSGSVGTFVSQALVQSLGLETEECPAATFKAADGGRLPCSTRVPKLQWCVQGYKFTSEARVLNLQCCDMILGEDWLEAVSPVWVDYKTKEMRITFNGKRVALKGIIDQVDRCPEIGAKN
jgi:hypothetical protein